MRRAPELERHLNSLGVMREAVTAMKSLSAHHVRKARIAAELARTYREGVARFAAVGGRALATAGDGGAGLLVFGSELGLCGVYNSQVATSAAQRRAELGLGPTLCVGQRAASLLAQRGVEIRQRYAAPGAVEAISDVLLRVAEDVLELYAQHRLSRFEIVASRFDGVGLTHPVSSQLLPIVAPAELSVPARRYVNAEYYARAVNREFLYSTLYGVLLDAFASEHGARLIASQAAERWLDERIERLKRQVASTRRESSTQEVLEIASGARQMSGRKRSTRAQRASGKR